MSAHQQLTVDGDSAFAFLGENLLGGVLSEFVSWNTFDG